MKRIDCLFIHAARRVNGSRLFRYPAWLDSIPMGLFGLADLIHRQGVSTQILHVGVEELENRSFSLLSYLDEVRPAMIGLDLHWHHQSFEVIETARRIKAVFPTLYLFLGGGTASFFHEEIMKNFDSVDGIIRGEAEAPAAELASVLLKGRDNLFFVPNLTWRRKGSVLINPLSYVATEKDLNALSYTNYPLLKNYTTYIRYGRPAFVVGGSSKRERLTASSRSIPAFHVHVGRGCPVQCTWCGGGMPHQETISGRREVVFRGTEEVLRSIKEAVSYGYKALHISFDPFPDKPEYYLRLFGRLKQERLHIECRFESFGLPTIDFICAFKETFPGSASRIALSPDVGSGRARKFHKGYAYSNLDLLECLRQMEAHQVFCDLFFTLGIPFETVEDVQETFRFQKEIRRRFQNVKRILTSATEMEPGSPWHLDPEGFGVRTSLKDFVDFYHFHSRKSSSLGYWIPDYLPGVNDEDGFERALREMKHRPFRFGYPGARSASHAFRERRPCDLTSLASKLKVWVGKKV